MLRHILVIHESKTIRTIIRNYVMSELSDVSIIEVSSPAQGIEEFEQTRYDVVFSGREMSGYDGFTLIERMRESAVNDVTPFVMVSSGALSPDIMARLQDGLDYYLTMPFNPHSLSDLINKLADPRQLRQFKRVSIAGALVQLHLDNGELECDVVNISKNGILCDVTNREGHNDLLRDVNINILLPMRYDHLVIKDIWCKLLRIVVLSWSQNNFPERLRIVWQFVDIDEHESQKLDALIDRALKEQVIR